MENSSLCTLIPWQIHSLSKTRRLLKMITSLRLLTHPSRCLTNVDIKEQIGGNQSPGSLFSLLMNDNSVPIFAQAPSWSLPVSNSSIIVLSLYVLSITQTLFTLSSDLAIITQTLFTTSSVSILAQDSTVCHCNGFPNSSLL